MAIRKTPPSVEDKKNTKIGCGIIAGLLLVGGCYAAIDGEDSSSGSSSSSSASDLGDSEVVTVEDYVGTGLQEAQDAAQEQGIYKLRSADFTGRGRAQVWDRNWTVCEQTPAAGSRMETSDTLVFNVVNHSEGETCEDPTGGLPEDSTTSTGGTRYDDDLMDGNNEDNDGDGRSSGGTSDEDSTTGGDSYDIDPDTSTGGSSSSSSGGGGFTSGGGGFTNGGGKWF